MENVVTMKLEDYLKMHDRINEQTNAIVIYGNENFLLKEKLSELKKQYLEEHINEYTVKRYTLKELVDIDNYSFPFDNKRKLLKLGFTYEELVDFIKEKKEKYESKIEEEDENE